MILDKPTLDLYSDYLISSLGGLTTATELSKLTNQALSNDKISRFLGGVYQENKKLQHTEYQSKDLWKLVKPIVRKYESLDSYLIIDDTIQEKQYSDVNEVICWHFDHCFNRQVKGVNILNFILVTPDINIPLALEVIKKTEKYTIIKEDKLQGKWHKLDTITDITKQEIENKPLEVWLEGLDHSIHLIKQIFTNEDDSIGVQFLITNDSGLSKDNIVQHYQKRWQVEEYHKSIKSNLGLSKSPTKTVTTQINHFFCSIYAYIQLEYLTKSTKITNHFQLKSKLYLEALKRSFEELAKMRLEFGCER